MSPGELHTQTSVKHLLQNSGSPDTSWSLDSQPGGHQAATAQATCGSGVQSEWRIWGLLSGSSIGGSGGWRRTPVCRGTGSDLRSQLVLILARASGCRPPRWQGTLPGLC